MSSNNELYIFCEYTYNKWYNLTSWTQIAFQRSKILFLISISWSTEVNPSKNIVIVFDCPPPRKSLVKGERFIRLYEGRPDINLNCDSKQFIDAWRQTFLRYFRQYQRLVFNIERVFKWAFKRPATSTLFK